MTEVVAALIWDNDRFLACQRPKHKARGLMWEFVGGKVEPNETKQQALIRECREELAITIGTGLDQLLGEGTEAVSLLEKYCELVWQCSQIMGKNEKLAMLADIQLLATMAHQKAQEQAVLLQSNK